MDKKNLIVSGCSFTIGHNLGELGSWAYYLNKSMNLTLHNRARGGVGNQYIANSIIGYLIQNKELISNSIVIVGWSEITRGLGTFTTKDINGNKIHELVTIRPQDFIIDESKSYWTTDENSYHGYTLKHSQIIAPYFSTWNYRVYETYVAMLSLKNFLKLYNIPYIFFDAINDNNVIINSDNMLELKTPLNSKFPTLCLNEEIEYHMSHILNQTIIDEIFNDENYISFGDSKSMNEYMYKDASKSHNWTYGNDGHPNDIAAKHFSTMIFSEYERLYNK